jgi:hypothetical protein
MKRMIQFFVLLMPIPPVEYIAQQSALSVQQVLSDSTHPSAETRIRKLPEAMEYYKR